MIMRILMSVLTLLVSFAVWLMVLPYMGSRMLPPSAEQFVSRGDTPGLLVGFIVIPALLGILGFAAIVSWLWVSSLFLTRQELEGLIVRNVFGGSVGKIETRLLDRFYSKR